MKLLSKARWEWYRENALNAHHLKQTVKDLEENLMKHQALLSAAGFNPVDTLLSLNLEKYSRIIESRTFSGDYQKIFTQEEWNDMAKKVIGRPHSGDEVKEVEATEERASNTIYTNSSIVTECNRPYLHEVVRPAHYHAGGIDVIEFAGHHVSREQMVGFHRINVLKYLTRYDKKNGVEDLLKARTYLDKLIALEEVPFDANV